MRTDVAREARGAASHRGTDQMTTTRRNRSRMIGLLAGIVGVLLPVALPGGASAADRGITGGVTAHVQGQFLIIVDQTLETGVTTRAISFDSFIEVSSDGAEIPGDGCPLVVDVLRCNLAPGGVTRMVVYLGQGDDTFDTDTGMFLPMTLHGGTGADLLGTGNGNDLVFAGPGDDRFTFNAGGNDTVYGEGGHDFIRNNAGTKFFGSGGVGNDVIVGGNGVSTLLGGDGFDRLFVRDDDGDDFVNGGNGFDTAKFDGGDTVLSIEHVL